MPVEKSAIPLVAVEFMNVDHHEAVDLANILEERLTADAGVDEQAVGSALQAFLDHTREHFAREEEEMVRTMFPVYHIHKSEHDRVLEDMDVVYRDWVTDKDAGKLLAWVQGPLPAWLVEHIQTMDTITAQFIGAAG